MSIHREDFETVLAEPDDGSLHLRVNVIQQYPEAIGTSTLCGLIVGVAADFEDRLANHCEECGKTAIAYQVIAGRS